MQVWPVQITKFKMAAFPENWSFGTFRMLPRTLSSLCQNLIGLQPFEIKAVVKSPDNLQCCNRPDLHRDFGYRFCNTVRVYDINL